MKPKKKPAKGAIQGRIGVDGTLLECEGCGERVHALMEGLCRVCFAGGDAPLRDQFAMAAIPVALVQIERAGFFPDSGMVAMKVYAIADAMMKARRE